MSTFECKAHGVTVIEHGSRRDIMANQGLRPHCTLLQLPVGQAMSVGDEYEHPVLKRTVLSKCEIVER